MIPRWPEEVTLFFTVAGSPQLFGLSLKECDKGLPTVPRLYYWNMDREEWVCFCGLPWMTDHGLTNIGRFSIFRDKFGLTDDQIRELRMRLWFYAEREQLRMLERYAEAEEINRYLATLDWRFNGTGDVWQS